MKPLIDALVPLALIFLGSGLWLGWRWAGGLLTCAGILWAASWAFAHLVGEKREPEL